jgi:integrase/recombinase XerD
MAKIRRLSFGALLESFFMQRLVRQRQASPATIQTYKDALRLLVQFAAQRLDKPVDRLVIEDVDPDLVLAFLDCLERERGNSARSRNARLAVIRSFFQHVAFSDPAAIGLAQRIRAIGLKRTTRRVVGFLHPPDVHALLGAPDRQTRQGRRDYTLLLFLVCSGARVSEAVGVNAGDLQLDPPRQVLIRGKGAKERVVPLDKDLAARLKDLRAERAQPAGADAPVFVDARGRRLTRFGVTHVVRRMVKAASKQCPHLRRCRISPHTFRHTAAMRLLQAGVDLAVIRAWLGHVDIQTTHHYLEADVEMKRQALAAAGVISQAEVRFDPPSQLLALLER